MPGDNEQYLADQLDQIHRSMRQGDVDGVVRQVGHVRGESDSQTADTLMRLALDRELKESRKKIRIWMAVAIVVAIGAAITIVAAMPRTRIGTDTAAEPTLTPTQVSTVPVPVNTPSAPNSSAAPPVPLPDTGKFAVLHDLTDFNLGRKSCGNDDEATLDIDELAPGYDNATIQNADCSDGFGLSHWGGKYMAKLPTQNQPAAEECETLAKRGSQRAWKIDDVKPGEFAACVVSKKNNVAWLKVVDKDPRGRLMLKIIVWKPQPR